MVQIRQTLQLYLTHSLLTIGAILLLFIVLVPIQLHTVNATGDSEQILFKLLFINLVLSAFVGVYFGGGFLKLKQVYLWLIHKGYQKTLTVSFLIWLAFFSAIQAWVMWDVLGHWSMVCLLPMAAAVFSAQSVLGDNLTYKILLPAVPIVIGQLYWTGMSIEYVALLVLAAAAIMVSQLPKQGRQFALGRRSELITLVQSQPGSQPTIVQKFNYWLAKLTLRFFNLNNRSLDWAIFLPHTKLSLPVFGLGTACLFFILMMSNKQDYSFVILLMVLFMTSLLLGVIVEARSLLKQVKSFVHLYQGPRHKVFKQQLKRSIDLQLLRHFSLLFLMLYLFSLVFALNLNLPQLSVSALLVFAISWSYYPAMICFAWVNANWRVVSALVIYWASVLAGLKLFEKLEKENNLLLGLVLLVSFALLVRWLTSKALAARPIEFLLKNH